MGKINVHLLGRPYVEVDGERINFPYKKAEGFFLLFMCEKERNKGRNYLCSLGCGQ